MRQDIEFDAGGTTLRGWLYVPDGAHGPSPTIVMSHGFSATKELFLDAFAEAFCDAGMCALVYDNRCLGASDGLPCGMQVMGREWSDLDCIAAAGAIGALLGS